MRRAEKEITDKNLIGEILYKADVLRLAMVDKGEPYLIPMNYVYVDGIIYMHSARQGRKIEILKENSKVAFQADTDVELIIKDDACGCGTKYMSVCGVGRAMLIDDKKEKITALDALMHKHTGKKEFQYTDKILDSTMVIKIEVDSVTGKKSGF